MVKTALITGATSGIGMATAKLFAKNNIDLILCGRREERLKELKYSLEKFVKVTTLNFDIKDRAELEKSFNGVSEEISKVDILINNAGGAIGLNPIQNVNYLEMEQMIDINIKGLLSISNLIIPKMVDKKSGIIINIGSIAGKEVYANGNVYCATKHAVDAITKAMRIDLNQYGIKVASINPGMVETEFSINRFNGDVDKAKKVYQGIEPLTGEDIAETIFFMVTRPPHVVIADLTIFPLAQASSTVVNRQAL